MFGRGVLREKVSERSEGGEEGEGGEAGGLFIGYNPINKLLNLIEINQKVPKNKQTCKHTTNKGKITTTTTTITSTDVSGIHVTIYNPCSV